MDFFNNIKDVARNPLGIIAIFISLIYGMASLLLNSSAEKLTVPERWPLIIFIVLFPVMILVVFYKLVTNHHWKLYAPGDFKEDKSFLRTLSPEEKEEKLDMEIIESMELKGRNDIDRQPAIALKREASATDDLPEIETTSEYNFKSFRDEVKKIEDSTINLIANEFNVVVERNIGVGNTDTKFDAFLQKIDGKYTFLEIKALRSQGAAMMMIDRLLYNAVVADKFFKSNFKLIVVFVYFFDEKERDKTESFLRRKVSNCPADVEMRFISRHKILIS